jgi:hypothetical protein
MLFVSSITKTHKLSPQSCSRTQTLRDSALPSSRITPAEALWCTQRNAICHKTHAACFLYWLPQECTEPQHLRDVVNSLIHHR